MELVTVTDPEKYFIIALTFSLDQYILTEICTQTSALLVITVQLIINPSVFFLFHPVLKLHIQLTLRSSLRLILELTPNYVSISFSTEQRWRQV